MANEFNGGATFPLPDMPSVRGEFNAAMKRIERIYGRQSTLLLGSWMGMLGMSPEQRFILDILKDIELHTLWTDKDLPDEQKRHYITRNFINGFRNSLFDGPFDQVGVTTKVQHTGIDWGTTYRYECVRTSARIGPIASGASDIFVLTYKPSEGEPVYLFFGYDFETGCLMPMERQKEDLLRAAFDDLNESSQVWQRIEASGVN